MDPARLFAAVAGMPLPDAAARIATGGVPVFPCVPGGKRPLVEHGFHEATAAARQVGMTKASAYCLRARADAASFANAWDRVMTPPGSGRSAGPRDDYRKLTVPALFARVDTGLVQPVLYRGRMTAIRRKADNSALLHLVRRCTHEPAEPREGRARR